MKKLFKIESKEDAALIVLIVSEVIILLSFAAITINELLK